MEKNNILSIKQDVNNYIEANNTTIDAFLRNPLDNDSFVQYMKNVNDIGYLCRFGKFNTHKLSIRIKLCELKYHILNLFYPCSDFNNEDLDQFFMDTKEDIQDALNYFSILKEYLYEFYSERSEDNFKLICEIAVRTNAILKYLDEYLCYIYANYESEKNGTIELWPEYLDKIFEENILLIDSKIKKLNQTSN